MLENGYEDGLAGVNLINGDNQHPYSPSLIRMVGRLIRNLNGRIENPAVSGGYRHSNQWGTTNTGFLVAQALQIVMLRNPTSFYCGQWDIENLVDQHRFEDMLSIDTSTGQSTSELLFEDILGIGNQGWDWADDGSGRYGAHVSVQGGPYANGTEYDDYGRYLDDRGLGNSGSMGMIADGDQANWSTQYTRFNRFTAIACNNAGLGINGGQHNTIENGVVLSSHKVWGTSRDFAKPGWVPVQFYDNHALGNIVRNMDVGHAVMYPSESSPTIYGVQSGFDSAKFQVINCPTRSSVSQADEVAAVNAHRNRVLAAGVTVGPLT